MPGRYIFPLNSNFLSLSGGTVTGNTNFTGGLQVSGITFNVSGMTSGDTFVFNDTELVPGDGSSTAANVSYTNTGFSYTNVQEALDALLYVSPSISTFTNTVGTVERGTVVTSVPMSWSINKTVTTQSLNQSIGSIPAAARTYTHSGLTLSSTTTYTLTVSDGTNNANANTTVSFNQKRYWGVSTATTLSSSGILAIGNSEFATSRTTSKTLDATGGRYLYFAYPTSFGQGTFTVGGLVTTFQESTVSFTNSTGYVENYYLYRSNNLQNGSSITVQIT